MKREPINRYLKDIPISDIQKAFAIDFIPGVEVVDQMRTEMSDKLFDFTEKIIEPLLGNPENLCCMFEQGMMDRDDMKELFSIYKKVQELKWKHNLLILTNDKKGTEEWIKSTWKLWTEDIQQKLIRLCEKLSDGWAKVNFTDAKTDYHL
jgi:hypothetical protein